ncbi:MAG: bifunctional phosphoribosyl-AMP cyclohydrolase/phosphoribosyl-ATP diphosphatase HisIE [Candidatus Pacebacteria bacterium]|nr:bifunctional phosphoribosyl-AMP cyclohydrolase/phosphoribosyl-ATP diphosphatase HisIE [Candidatus Paceibacterota bacterium]
MKKTKTKIEIQNYKKLDFKKGAGLIPAVVQDFNTREVLMVAYMNEASLKKTLTSKKVTFFSRSKNRLWTKGETSKNYLRLNEIYSDCDGDSLLVVAAPNGPTCHIGTTSCFVTKNDNANFLPKLQKLIKERKMKMPKGSYTTELFKSGINRMAQKVGEEGVEVVIASKGSKKQLVSESADLLYHLMVLLTAKNSSITEVINELSKRNS